MPIKKFVKIFFILFIFLLLFFFIYSEYFKTKEEKVIKNQNEDISYNSNILKDIEYKTKDKDGNE